MKRHFAFAKLNAIIVALSLLLYGCSADDFQLQESGEEMTLRFTPTIDAGARSRAISDGSGIDQLVVAVYENGSEFNRQVYDWDQVASGVDIRVFKGRSYDILFWAQNSQNEAYTIEDDGSVSIDYNAYLDGGSARMEEMDAFCATRQIDATSAIGGSITLRRPLAQFNLGADGVHPAEGVHKSVVTIEGVPGTFNPFMTGYAARATSTHTFTFTDFPDEKLQTASGEYGYVATCYILAPAQISVTYTLYDASTGNEILSKTFEDVPLQSNQRTNICGNIGKY